MNDDLDRASLRVLIVDDDAEMRALLGAALRREGYWMIAVAGADEALEVAVTRTIHAVILDNLMPGTQGIELLPVLRRRCPWLPVIFVTAFGGREVGDEALRRGAACYLEKPFRLETLLEMVERVTRG